jgi:hypothetical protein
MRTRIRTLAAILVAAFLLATDPVVADAARTITGKDIRNGTVTAGRTASWVSALR